MRKEKQKKRAVRRFPYPCEFHKGGCGYSSCDGLAEVPERAYQAEDDSIVYYPRCYKLQSPQILSSISEEEFKRAKRGEFVPRKGTSNDTDTKLDVSETIIPAKGDGFTPKDRQRLNAIYDASVLGKETPTGQIAAAVRKDQIEFGLNLYRPRTKHTKGISFRTAAIRTIKAERFEGAEGSYKMGEVKSLAQAIRRAFLSPKE